MMAGAGLNKHHLFGERFSLCTLELHLGCDGGVWRAAAIVCADTTELLFVHPGAGAARQLEAKPMLGLWCPDAFLPLLWDGHIIRSQCHTLASSQSKSTS